MARQLDLGAANPRLQCGECGQWKRLHGRDAESRPVQRFFSCSATKGDHPCGGEVCSSCCPDKCRERLEARGRQPSAGRF